ncbi:rhamnogalacturonan lyase [Cohnella zeiphila]|uniref:Rhamnogalacturonan lyase n=1 Tax=Cohnella zeiphila TaxID=2761120 RepID=A0A7X0VUZ6_9BACL|nr:rhamnogalacturonan lyase [Cohnella zeiphila]
MVWLTGASGTAGNRAAAAPADAPKWQMEYLDRGLVAVQTDQGVFVSWRLLGTEPDDTTFNLYRNGQLLNPSPLADGTNDTDPEGTGDDVYAVSAVVNGVEQPRSGPARAWGSNHLRVPLRKPADGVNPDGTPYTYSANDASVGDLDGDGQYEIVLKWDPSNSKDNSQDGVTGNVYVDAYELDGTLLWRIDLGKNIRAGAHYTQFMVYDLDGDGKAEVAMKTADGTTDGTGQVIGDPNADYRDLTGGRVLSGPEYLTIFEGATGKQLATTDYDPPRGNVSDWGDNYGNRVDRFLACIAYLDGERPSLVMARGYYTRTVLVAYNWRDGQLTKLWKFDSNNPGYGDYVDQGNHNLSVADVDGDGKDEIVYGAMTVDDNGQGLYNTGLGHGDALHVGDLDPTRPGLEVFKVLENKPYGAAVWDAAAGEVLWRVTGTKDTGRGVSADIDPNYPGEEVWAPSGVGLYTIKGDKIGDAAPSMNFAIWWDGDLQRELLDDNHIDKWDYANQTMTRVLTAEGDASNNGTKATPSLQADLFGDWREEAVWRTEDSTALDIYTTTAPTEHRFHTLMHDPVYRLGAAWQNVAYNQPPHPSFFLGYDMAQPPAPNVYELVPASVDVEPNTLNKMSQGGDNSLTVRVALPDGLGGQGIRATSAALTVNGQTIEAQNGTVPEADSSQDGNAQITLKFDRRQTIAALGDLDGDVSVKVDGALTDGNRFVGTGSIRVIH